MAPPERVVDLTGRVTGCYVDSSLLGVSNSCVGECYVRDPVSRERIPVGCPRARRWRLLHNADHWSGDR